MSRYAAYMICTSPRSGSTLLCHLLRQTGKAGFPESHFHEPSLDAWLEEFGLEARGFASHEAALRAVFRSAIACGKGESDIFGLRMQRHSFAFFASQLAILYPALPDDASRIEAAFGKTLFVHLKREDKLNQAISWVKARQSGLWHLASDGTELERLSAPAEPVYDPAAIAAQLARQEEMEAAWEQWFATGKITPLRVTYSALSAAPYKILGRVLEELGIARDDPQDKTPPVAKLSDALNDEWAARFRAETGLQI